ncbi:MAG: hypothetical protein KBS44_07070, partial [Clostridiales bacterium]|nr:hypothetical protein [Candidatus Coliplasma equi]
LWYSDTFPGREGLIKANNSLQSLYGITGEVISSSGHGDDIPDDTMGEEDVTGPIHIDIDPEKQQGEQIDGFYLVGNTAYELYHFNQENSKTYTQLINRAAQTVGSDAKVYDLIVPLSYSLYLSGETQEKVGVSDCKAAIDYMYSGMNSEVIKVDAFSALASHTSEYLYYRTDHHWTARGAYYAYSAFCKKAGITPTPLSSYNKAEFGGFLGTLYSDTNMPAAMAKDPDTVEAFIPKGTNTIRVTDKTGETLKYSNGIVNINTDKVYQAAASKYNCFIVGDNPLSTIHNETIKDGSSIAVVKESFGNAFVPFLVDSYEYIYVIDYRYFNKVDEYKNTSLSQFVREKGIKTVLFINNMVATSASPRLNELSTLIG